MRKVLHLFCILIVAISCSDDETQNPAPAPVIKYTITLLAGEGGTVSNSGGEYNEGQTVSVTANPQGDYLFVGWSDGSADATRNIIVDATKTLTANFEKRKYPLTINIEGEGEVEEEIVNAGRTTEYDSGTTVKLSAVPSEGWEFVGWTGAIESEEMEIQIVLNEMKEVIALFKNETFEILESDFTLDKTVNNVLSQLQDQFTFHGIAGTFHYNNETGDYLVFPGHVKCGPGDVNCDGISTALDIAPAPTVVLKKQIDGWKVHRIYKDVATWNIRNYKVKDNEIVLGDANELGTNWKGHAWFGKILGEEIQWTKVTNTDTMHFFHGITFGDINSDGRTDVIGGPAIGLGNKDYYYPIFIQQNDNTFIRDNNTLIKYPRDENGHITISGHEYGFEMGDVNNDGNLELIIAGSNPGVFSDTASEEYITDWVEKNIHKLKVYGRKDSSKIELLWQSNSPYEFYPKKEGRYFSATSVKTSDFNNDGYLDVAVSREHPYEGEPYISFEIWLNNGDGSFKPHFVKIFDTNEIEFREFEVMDANNDGFTDIILKCNKHYYLSNNWDERFNGVQLNKAIWINDGSGKFNEYDKKELILKDVYPEKLIPYMSENEFHIAGPAATKPFDFSWTEIEVKMFDIKIKL